MLQKVLDALPASLQGPVYDGTPSNPTEAAVREAAALFKEHRCDGLIAVGGGSSLDCAKGVAIAATHPGPLVTYATIEGGSGKITEGVAPLIAVPTTAGTGSESGKGRRSSSPTTTGSSASIRGTSCHAPRSATPNSRSACRPA